MQTLINQFIDAKNTFLITLDHFPKEKRLERYFGTWNLKDVIAHFSAWNIYFTNCLKLLKFGKKIPHWGKINEFNEAEIKKREDWGWGKVYAEFNKSGDAFIQEFMTLETNLIRKQLWDGKSYTPLKLFMINLHHYQKAQLTDIKKLLKKWEK